MLKTAFQQYINNFRGFSREILTSSTFINRAGTMVLPFIKVLKEDLQFTYGSGLDNGGFGFGSMLGSWLGGKLSDKIGFYKVMVLVCSPVEFSFCFAIHYNFFCIGMFSL
jgi:MFS family permease